MAFGNLSIVKTDGPGAVRPRIPEQRSGSLRNAEARNSERAKSREVATGETRGAERTKFRSRQSEEGSLTLTTAEGDKVTISFRNQQSTRVDQGKLYGPDGSFEKTRVRTKSSSELSVSLEGNLSEAELKDITELVAKLSSGLESARGGDVEGAQKQIASSGNLGSIQNYSFAYQQSSDVSFQSKRLSVTA
jgi:hypothetical protein